MFSTNVSVNFVIFFTLAAVVRFPTCDPLSTLESPVVRIRQNHLHEHVVVGSQTQTSDVKAQKWKHPPGRNAHNCH